ncbi:MAG: hypothetical protein WBS19_16340 [Candidatus Korobacteraceae bacterium]
MQLMRSLRSSFMLVIVATATAFIPAGLAAQILGKPGYIYAAPGYGPVFIYEIEISTGSIVGTWPSSCPSDPCNVNSIAVVGDVMYYTKGYPDPNVYVFDLVKMSVKTAFLVSLIPPPPPGTKYGAWGMAYDGAGGLWIGIDGFGAYSNTVYHYALNGTLLSGPFTLSGCINLCNKMEYFVNTGVGHLIVSENTFDPGGSIWNEYDTNVVLTKPSFISTGGFNTLLTGLAFDGTYGTYFYTVNPVGPCAACYLTKSVLQWYVPGGTSPFGSLVIPALPPLIPRDVSAWHAPYVQSCMPASSPTVLVSGTNVVAYVPQGHWYQGYGNTLGGNKGVAVANLEGNYITGSPVLLSTPDYVNSCASDSTLSQTVCTANGNDVYIFSYAPTPALTYTVKSGASAAYILFSGGYCTTCEVATDAVHNLAVIGLSVKGVPGFQFLNLSSGPPVFNGPPIASPARQISEGILIDTLTNPPWLLSAAEGEYCVPLFSSPCPPNYEIADISDRLSPVFYENNLPYGQPDSSAMDCSAQVALATFETTVPSTTYLADFTKLTHPTSKTWAAPSQLFTLTNASLGNSQGNETGPIAVAQGSHEGVLGEEWLPNIGDDAGNKITAFRLNSPYSATTPYAAWMTCDLGGGFVQGADPHALTAYQSPNFPFHSFAVLANQSASELAVVDLDEMLLLKETSPGSHLCEVGTMSSPTVIFVPL